MNPRPLPGPARRRWLAQALATGAAAWGLGGAAAQPAAPAAPAAEEPGGGLRGELAAHDPTLWLAADGTQWVFATGEGLARLFSRDGRQWERRPPVFTPTSKPAWWAQHVPAHQGLDVWAPKLFAHRGRLWVMYSISTFGKRTSAIGLASAPLTEGAGAATWRDDGVLLTSSEARSDEGYNAIDPDFHADEDGRVWMAWGSWWQGLQLTELDPDTLRPRGPVTNLARRRGGIEAPTLLRHGGHMWLFMSWGLCCKGVDSTYEMRVGRAASVQGPFVDREGRLLTEGGGTLLLAGGARFKGPGHQDVITTPAGAEMVWHAYDAEAAGQPRLRRALLRWGADGWPAL
ncbi:arabinan endo-1,5-alpha-L-arabinosidase [Rubrivivax rivuli]|uniref:Extracellular exo-alpha-(1->5)-L-arabinofuranosidase n=1 Tax=Rubrivivax rivuli TaxID=1862385 RepID=A0A437RAW8_9BURK|nr:arabinan endo-1,5-alpha-L-arabinosidase [Rubrivivax rivuli]RVU43938.1 arabinan endo-1,5-alpha-L-arabinosidase [Rubrivivax rivuli]